MLLQGEKTMLQQCYSSDEESDHCAKGEMQNWEGELSEDTTLSQTMIYTITNLAYNLKHSSYLAIPMIQRKPICIRDDQSLVYLLGQHYYFQTKDAFLMRFQKTIWLSYREGIQKIHGDIGWGCMIRVTQMILAETLQRSLHQQPTQIVRLFREGADSPFSLLNICQEGNIRNRWTGSIQMFTILRQLLNKQNDFWLSTQIHCGGINIPDFNVFMSGLSKEGSPQNGRVIVIQNQFQGSCIAEKYHSHFYHMMKHESFCGLAGGIGGDALYVIGHYDDNLIVLDPHYVQKASEDNYFKTTPRGIPISKMCPSFAFCYYLKDDAAYTDWIIWMIHANMLYAPDTVFSVDVQNQQKWLAKLKKTSDDDFEMLSSD